MKDYKPGDLVKLNENFFKRFGEVPLVGLGEFRRESRGIIVEPIHIRKETPSNNKLEMWYILWDSGMMKFDEIWLERVCE